MPKSSNQEKTNRRRTMSNNKTAVGIGIDLGSSNVRVGIYRLEDDSIIKISQRDVPYYYDDDPSCLWNYTQQSDQIMTAIYDCLLDLQLEFYDVKSCGVSATCSMAIFRKSGNILKPFAISKDDEHKNVVFWMDSSSLSECQKLNEDCPSNIKDYMGGNFIPEMAVPKLRRLIENIKDFNVEDGGSIELFDLHRYIAFMLAKKFDWNYHNLCNSPNLNGIAHDGELSGWSSEFYEEILNLPKIIKIRPLKNEDKFNPRSGKVKVASCIDCYSSWLSLCSADFAQSLFIVAGTSTCYIYTSKSLKSTINGVWGPFTNIIGNDSTYSVYESGQSCTGKLIEYLFEVHPASSSIPRSDWGNLIKRIENEIHSIEIETKESIHFKTKDMFLYGDLQGNRTPFGDPFMTGAFIGETIDFSFRNLVYKYVCVLECLAFQIRVMITIFTNDQQEDNITELRICGSQAKNERLLLLTSVLNRQISIKIPKGQVSLSGVKGAYLLGKSSSLGINLLHAMTKETEQFITFSPSCQVSLRLIKLLEAKYQIHLDLAKQQLKYRAMVKDAISA